jgi:hypothetical protein
MSTVTKKLAPHPSRILQGTVKKDIFANLGSQISLGGTVTLQLPQHHKPLHHHHEETHVDLESPTSISMKNSYIIKNADPSFEQYYNTMRKRNKLIGSPERNIDSNMQRMQGKRPIARDGHTGIVFNNTMLVFGGDRHHMSFNDLFMLDLKRQLHL